MVRNSLALNLCVFLVTLAVTEELFLVAPTYELWECVKDIHFVIRRNIDEKEVAFQKSLRLCATQRQKS